MASPSRGEGVRKATGGGNEDHVCRDDRHGEDTLMGAGLAQWILSSGLWPQMYGRDRGNLTQCHPPNRTSIVSIQSTKMSPETNPIRESELLEVG